jgi:hypothetical protein
MGYSDSLASSGRSPDFLLGRLEPLGDGNADGCRDELFGAGLEDQCRDLLGAVDADPGAAHPAARAVATELVRCQSDALDWTR